MRTLTVLSTNLAVIVMSLLLTLAAQAAPRTFVSSAGSGSVCSRAIPCASLQAAHDDTDPGGEIDCLDTVDSISLGITKSITIDCAGTNGGVVPANQIGILVQAPNSLVTLRGLTVNGLGAGTVGIILNSGTLRLENCRITGYRTGAAAGISVTPQSGITANLHVVDSIIEGNGAAASGGGIIIQPSGTGAARVVIERSRIASNTYGIFANGMGSTGPISVQIRDSVAVQNAFNGISAFTAPGQSIASITVDRSSSLLNGADGILAQGAPAFVLLSASTVISNQMGLHALNNGNILSFQDNKIVGNITDGAPTAVLTTK